MNQSRNSLADLLASYDTTRRNALCDRPLFGSLSPWWDTRPKDEWVDGHYKRVYHGLHGYSYEWVPGYWRRSAW